jgi:hypothetical protein
MAYQVGRLLPLTAPRRLICDLVHFARRTPTVPVQRRMRLAPLAEARARQPRPVRWCTLFTKAFARVAAVVPELRRAYLSFPRPRLYEHPHSVASVAVERRYRGDNVVLFTRLVRPEDLPLCELDGLLRRAKEDPVESIRSFSRALAVSRLPSWLRRPLWWVALNCSGYRRARWLGTFGVSTYSGLGAESLHPLSPLTATLNYGVIGRGGSVAVRITYDHRVLDGATVARALARMEAVLNRDLAGELRGGRLAAA